jgi:hypothetical protein
MAVQLLSAEEFASALTKAQSGTLAGQVIHSFFCALATGRRLDEGTEGVFGLDAAASLPSDAPPSQAGLTGLAYGAWRTLARADAAAALTEPAVLAAIAGGTLPSLFGDAVAALAAAGDAGATELLSRGLGGLAWDDEMHGILAGTVAASLIE